MNSVNLRRLDSQPVKRQPVKAVRLVLMAMLVFPEIAAGWSGPENGLLSGSGPRQAQELGQEVSGSTAGSTAGSTIGSTVRPAAEPAPWLPVETFRLRNGVQFYVVHRPFSEIIAAGWAVRSGGADDGHSGIAHLVEHLLFQGSETIGTKDWEREKELLAAEERLIKRSNGRGGSQRSKSKDLAAVRRNLRLVQRPGELAKLWAEGAVQGTGALTTKDFSFYTGSFPKEHLEAWMWLEVDRLANSVMRGMEREKGVVREESLQRVAGVSQGDAEVAFDVFFWGPSPYRLSTDGVEGAMQASTRSDALAFYRAHYRPDNIAVALVGDIDLASVKELAKRYFGRLLEGSEKGPFENGSIARGPAARDSAEKGGGLPSASSRRFSAEPEDSVFRRQCACRPSVRIRFPTVAYGHDDAVALDVLAAILNGRSGRLFRNVVGTQPAFAAYATHKAQARAGSFSVVAEASANSGNGPSSATGVAVLERLQAALMAEVGKLQGERGLREVELQRARNMLRAEAAREVKESGALRTRLLIDDALGDGARLREWPERLERVTLAQLQRVVAELLDSKRGVTFYLESDGMQGGASR